MREKKRYLLVQPDGVTANEARPACESALLEWLGEKGMLDAQARVIRVEPDGRAWVRCATKAIEDTVAALALKRTWKGNDAALRVIRAAGSVPRADEPGQKPRRSAGLRRAKTRP